MVPMVSPFIYSYSVPCHHQQQQQVRSESYPKRKCLYIPQSPRNRRLLFNRSRGQSLVCRALFIRRAMMASVALSKQTVMVVAGDNTQQLHFLLLGWTITHRVLGTLESTSVLATEDEEVVFCKYRQRVREFRWMTRQKDGPLD